MTTGSPDKSLYRMPDVPLQTRWYTMENINGTKGAGGKENFTRKGLPCTGIAAGGSLTLLDVAGSGTIRRIWATLGYREPERLRELKLQIYWDGAQTPAVNVPWGDFFCHPIAMTTFESACFSSPEGRSFNCVIPMPFKKSARVVITNESDKENVIFYEIDCTLGDRHDDSMLYFHSHWRRENPTRRRIDMTILPKVEGKGRFLGCNVGVKVDGRYNYWWGEGEVKIYLDGDTDYPTLCGTGTEDYIGTGYGQGRYSNAYQGSHYVGEKADPADEFADSYGFYRFHIPDPVYFYKDIRVTIQDMGGSTYAEMLKCMKKYPDLDFPKGSDGTEFFKKQMLEEAAPETFALTERTDDMCATAYWYMASKENGLGDIAGLAERTKDIL